MVRIGDFRIVRPKHEISQDSSIEWIAQAHAQREGEDLQRMRKLVSRFSCPPELIRFRGTELGDACGLNFSEMEVYRLTEHRHGVGIGERMRFFESASDRAFDRLYDGETAFPDHLIHVSCTGYVAPSPAQKWVTRVGRQNRTALTHAYHMGCYASLPAIRMAQGFLASAGENVFRVDIVHNELCSLHMNPADHSPEQFVVQSLFADGHIRYSVSSDGVFDLLAIHETLIPETQGAMTWRLDDWGMAMSLSRDVPALISTHISEFLEALLSKAKIPRSEIKEGTVFALHPGGPRIIENIESVLELKEKQTLQSREVLRQYGNMSSATLPHVWKKIAEDPAIPSRTPVISLAFGPGLTVFGSVMRKR